MNNETIEQLKKFGFNLHEESANFLILKERFFGCKGYTALLEYMKITGWDFMFCDLENNRFFFKKVTK